MEIVTLSDTSSKSIDDFVKLTWDRLQTVYRKVREFTQQTAQSREVRYNLKVKPAEFVKGNSFGISARGDELVEKINGQNSIQDHSPFWSSWDPSFTGSKSHPRSHPKVVYVDMLKPYTASVLVDNPSEDVATTSQLGYTPPEPDLEVGDLFNENLGHGGP